MHKKRLMIAGAIVLAVVAFVVGYFLYWSYHPHIYLSASTASPAQADYHNELVMVATAEHRGIPTAASVGKELTRMADWNDQVITELYTYTTPYDIRVSGENEDGHVTLRYAGYVTDQAGKTADYQREETFDLFVREEDFKLPSAEESAVPEHAAVVFDSGMKSGTATQEVTVGEHMAAITVGFDYDLQGDAKVITNIGPATAENRTGWHHVDSAVTIDEDKIIFSNEDAKAVVPVTYQASIGEGYASYDDTVVIDLSAE